MCTCARQLYGIGIIHRFWWCCVIYNLCINKNLWLTELERSAIFSISSSLFGCKIFFQHVDRSQTLKLVFCRSVLELFLTSTSANFSIFQRIFLMMRYLGFCFRALYHFGFYLDQGSSLWIFVVVDEMWHCGIM